MKRYLFIILFSIFSFILFAKNPEGLSVEITVNKNVKAQLNTNNFIYLWDDNSDFHMTIGMFNDTTDFFYDKESLKEINNFIDIVNEESSIGKNLIQITITDEYIFFEYENFLLSLKKKKAIQTNTY